jgi:hypothetical protein
VDLYLLCTIVLCKLTWESRISYCTHSNLCTGYSVRITHKPPASPRLVACLFPSTRTYGMRAGAADLRGGFHDSTVAAPEAACYRLRTASISLRRSNNSMSTPSTPYFCTVLERPNRVALLDVALKVLRMSSYRKQLPESPRPRLRKRTLRSHQRHA